MLETGQTVPAFELQETSGTTVTPDTFKGKWTVIYFYPKDNTPGCTTEACDFRDNFSRITDAGAALYGVSPDSLKSHNNFTNKHELPFPLLSDPEHTMLEAFGVWQEKKMYGKTYMGVVRSTFIVDPEGNVAHVWPKVKVKGHVDDVLGKLDELRSA